MYDIYNTTELTLVQSKLTSSNNTRVLQTGDTD